jgi:hypothetical protein
MPGPNALFGVSVVPLASEHAQIVEQVLIAEPAMLDLVGTYDHPAI